MQSLHVIVQLTPQEVDLFGFDAKLLVRFLLDDFRGPF